MAIDWEEFDKDVDIDNLEKDVQEAETRGDGEFEDVPYGKYEVKITKLELTKSKKGDPMISIWFDILVGQHKGQKIFMNQLVNQGFQIHTANEFLRSLQTGENIEFKGYSAYNILTLNVYEKIADSEFVLDYGENKKGYKTFKILEKFNADNTNNLENNSDDSSVKDELGW